MENILGLEQKELSERIGGPDFRAVQILEWLYSRGAESFESMTNLPRDLRQQLQSQFEIRLPEIVAAEISSDGTTKYALRSGGETIESVHMPERDRSTVCISSQAGCSFGCLFCVTARMNLRRHLTAGEILGEVLLVLKNHGRPPRFNIVFMGMGEPLHNYDQVMKAFRLMIHPRCLAISPRRITLSTVGYVPSLLRLKNEKAIPNLAVSLNAPNNKLRSELMPINRLYPLEILMKTLNELPLPHRRRITFEYVLLKGINDQIKHARELVDVTQSIRCKINLIPFNPDEHLPYEGPDEQVISDFAEVLTRGGRTVAVRRSRGRDISAACGQLGTHFINPSLIPLPLART